MEEALLKRWNELKRGGVVTVNKLSSVAVHNGVIYPYLFICRN